MTEQRVATWEKPGPGTWELDSSHAGAAPGPVQRAIYEGCLEQGMREGFEMFGTPLRTMQMRWVNGKFYRRLVPLIGGGRDLPTPPAAVLWVATRVHPAFRREEKKAKRSFLGKIWRDEIRRWDEEWKPALVKKNLELTDVEVASLDDGALADHLDEVYEHVLTNTVLHFRLHVSDMGPLGNLMVSLEDWGLHRDEAFKALIAASPATREPAEQLRAVASALRDGGVDPATIRTLGDVRAVPAAADRLDEYLRFHGNRMTTGYDVEDRTLLELPDVIVASIRGAATRPAHDVGDAVETSIAALREQVPAEHRVELDDLIDDARLSYGLRDENGPLTYEWPAGLLRRAMLECGRRVGLDPFELHLDELASLMRGGEGPSTEEIARRAEERRWWATLEAPAHLGPAQSLPPHTAMTEYLGRITKVILAVVDSLEALKSNPPLQGMGIGSEIYTGTARVVRDAVEALSTMEPGDVIVAPYTAPTYNAVLSMAGAIVTEEGGLLCHAAVIARELGLPAVIGAIDAMTLIPDGARVEVDPVAGVVRILE